MNAVSDCRNLPSFILMQGVLEKLKEREFPWNLTGKKLSTTWVLRYYVLRHAEISDPEAFILEQHENSTALSKVRKVLDLRRVLQVDTNISLKVGSQNWILAIHYKAKHGGKVKVIYLAAHSEAEMNLWITKLCYACKLEKQDTDSHHLVSVASENSVDDSSFPSSHNVTLKHQEDDSRSPSNSNSSNACYVNPGAAHAYIRLKDCSSTYSLGSSSASLSSSITTSSSTNLDHSISENISSKTSLLIPPPIPPKPGLGTHMKKYGSRNMDPGGFILDQPLSVPIGGFITTEKDDWSNETIRPDIIILDDIERTSVLDSSFEPSVSNSSAPKPLPRRRHYRNIPPEIDRSCKPVRTSGNRPTDMSVGQAIYSTDREKKNFTTQVHSNHSSYKTPLLPITMQNKQEAFHVSESIEMTRSVLDYLDPVTESLTSAPFIKSSQRPKRSCATEYTQIDEESTKAVLEANVRQDEMRRNGFSI